MSNRIEDVSATCGHIFIPNIISKLAKEVYCPHCNQWREIDHKPTAAEIAGVQIERQDFPEVPSF